MALDHLVMNAVKLTSEGFVELEVAAFLTKPLDLEALLSTVRAKCDQNGTA